jgi:hypothetical protein
MCARERRLRRDLIPFLLPLLALLASPAAAQTADSGVAVSGTAGTLGIGAEVTFPLAGPRLSARLGLHGFTYSQRREASQIDYDADAKLRTGTAFLDWHPGGGGFRLTGGAVWNGNRIDGRSRPSPTGTYDIGGVLVPVSVVQRLRARAEFDPVAPYAGIGWGNPAAAERRAGFSLDLGVLYQGKADVRLTPEIPAGSPINTVPGAREALDILLRREEQDLEDDAKDYDLYPVVSLGVWIRF